MLNLCLFFRFLDHSFTEKKILLFLPDLWVRSSDYVIRWAQRRTMNEKLPGWSVELTSLETTSTEKKRELSIRDIEGQIIHGAPEKVAEAWERLLMC